MFKCCHSELVLKCRISYAMWLAHVKLQGTFNNKTLDLLGLGWWEGSLHGDSRIFGSQHQGTR